MKRLVILFLTVLTIISCHREKNKTKLARIFDSYLYYEDIKDFIPKNLPAQDSIDFIKNYINSWLQEQIMLHYAQIILVNQKEEIEQKVNQYRKSLLISLFMDILIEKNLDSTISYEEIINFYNEHSQNFILSDNIVKCLIIKIKYDTPDLKTLISMVKEEQTDIEELTNFVTSLNGTIYNFKNWQYISEIPKKIKEPSLDINSFLEKKNYFEQKINNFLYIVKIQNYIAKNNLMPIELAEPQIKEIILKKRADKIIAAFKQQKFEEIKQKNQIELYVY